MDGIAQFVFGDEAEPWMIFPKHESAAFLAHALAIAFEQGSADILPFEGETSGRGGEVGADGEADQIDGVGHGPGFVEIVDTPDEAAFDVAPGAEIFDVQIADGEHVRGLGEIGAELRPELRPAVVSGAEEHEDVGLHVGVFQAEVFLVDVSALGQPGFELAGGFDDVHWGNDSGGEMGSQMGRQREAFHHGVTETNRRVFADTVCQLGNACLPWPFWFSSKNQSISVRASACSNHLRRP